MGCLIRLKDGAGYLTFNSEEAAKDFISKNLDRIEKLAKSGKKENVKEKEVQQGPSGYEELMLVSSDKTALALEILAQSNKEAYEKTKEQLAKMTSDDNWNTEEYNKTSELIGVGSLLKAARKSDGSRVILEYINSNYLNNVAQQQIVEYIFGDTKTKEEKLHYHRLWFDTSELGAVDEVKSAKYWADQINDEYRGSLSAEQLDKIDSHVKNTFSRNVKTMLYGEVLHKIVEHVIKKNGEDVDLVKILSELIDGSDHAKGWKDKYEKHEGFDISEELVQIRNQFIEKNAPTDLALSYMEYAKQRYQGILTYFKKKGSTVKIVPESRLLCKLKNPIDVDGHTKTHVQAKLDMVVLVDGVPNIVDLKVSLGGFENSESNPKSQKIFHTMAAYQLLGQKSGFLSGGGSFIEDVRIDETGVLKSKGELVDISQKVNEYSVKRHFKEMFEAIQTSRMVLDVDEINEQLTKLVDESSVKARKHSSVEKIALKLDPKKQSDGTYKIQYFVYDDDGKKVSKTSEGIQKSDLEKVKMEIAQDIAEQNLLTHEFHFAAFKKNLKTFVTGTSTTDIFLENAGDYKSSAFYRALFSKYKNNCRVIESEDLDKLGIILVETPVGVDILSFTEFETSTEWDTSLRDSHLFDSINVASEIRKTVGAVNCLKSLLVLNQILPKLDLEVLKINSVRVLHSGTTDSVIYTRAQMKEMLETSTRYLDISNTLKNSMADPLVDVLWQFLNFKTLPTSKGKNLTYRMTVGELELSEIELESIRSSSRQFIDLKTEDKILFLRSLANRLEDEFPTELHDPRKVQVSDVGILYQLINRAILIYQDTELMCETDEAKISLTLDSVDLVSNQNIQVLRKLVSGGIAEITDRYNETHVGRMRAEIKHLKTGSDYGFLNEAWGDGSVLYKNMFRTNSDGSLLNGDLILKNPWKDSSLKEHEIRFLKFALYTLNKYKNESWKSVSDMKESDLNESSYYFPLARARGIEKFKADGKIHFPNIRSIWEEAVISAQKIKEGFDSQLEHRASASDTFKAIYNEYSNREDIDLRRNLIESQGGIDNFSQDVETVLNLFVVAMESEDVYNNKVIPAARAIVYVMGFQEFETGTDLSNIIDTTVKYMKSVVYDDTVYSREYQKYMRVFAPLRTAASHIALGFNLMNLPRELVMGMFTTISRSMFSSYGAETFSLKDYGKAWGVMAWDTKDFVKRVTKIELLNEHFRMANMSISDIASQTTSNKVGFANVFNRWMGWTLVAPDYFNRMTMFIAQMMHDGCWDAYELHEDDAEISLKYDMSKDKRFDVYYRWMKQSGGDLNAIPASIKRTFLDQKTLYEAMRAEFNETLPASKQIKLFKNAASDSDWMLPKAYTNRQRDSLKSFSDLCFGYYDKETKSELYKTVIGVIFKQFMAYGSSKKMQYIKAGSTSTARGEFKQLTTSDGELVYRIPIKNEDGTESIISVTETELNEKYSDLKDIAEKPMVWTGTFIEGVFNSYWNFLKSIGLGTKQAIMGADPSEKSLGRQLIRKTLNEYGTKGSIRRSNLLQFPWELFLSLCFMWIVRLIIFEDPEQSGESYNAQLKKSSWGKQIAYSILAQATRDFNIFTTMQQHFFTWEIPTLSILSNVGRSFCSAFGDEDLNLAEEALKGITSSVGAFKIIRPITNLYFEEAKQN